MTRAEKVPSSAILLCEWPSAAILRPENAAKGLAGSDRNRNPGGPLAGLTAPFGDTESRLEAS